MKALGHYILDVDNRPVQVDTSTMDGLAAWAEFLEHGNRTVGMTQITSATRVSTVFLGLDHQFGRGPPLLFETMIFGGPLDEACWRYSSWDDAEAGHKAAVRRAHEAIGQKIDGRNESAG